jgi:serine/threonine-protein kinase HipA
MGLSPAQLGPLDRLALVGARTMGALVYQPEVELEPPGVVRLAEIEADVDEVLRGVKGPDLDRLIALGGSPQGARPKVLIQLSGDGSAFFGDRRHRAGCTPYLVKFRARDDEKHSGALELAYMRMAAKAGIDVPATTMLGRTKRHPGYFATQRFDREGARKLHMHTFAGLIEAPRGYAAGSYGDLLNLTRSLTQDERAVAEMFRRACFNVFAHNRDDHVRNFAFLMDERGRWRPSPAYDLTFSEGPGGEHSLLVGREGANPARADLLELAASVDLKRPKDIVDEVRGAVSKFERFAEQAEVPKRLTAQVARQLR